VALIPIQPAKREKVLTATISLNPEKLANDINANWVLVAGKAPDDRKHGLLKYSRKSPTFADELTPYANSLAVISAHIVASSLKEVILAIVSVFLDTVIPSIVSQLSIGVAAPPIKSCFIASKIQNGVCSNTHHGQNSSHFAE